MRSVIPAAAILLLLAGCLAAAPQQAASDDVIYDLVRLKLAEDRDVGQTNIQVAVKEGVVTLRGQMDRDKNRKKAEKIAKKVKGVRQVINELTLAPQ